MDRRSLPSRSESAATFFFSLNVGMTMASMGLAGNTGAALMASSFSIHRSGVGRPQIHIHHRRPPEVMDRHARLIVSQLLHQPSSQIQNLEVWMLFEKLGPIHHLERSDARQARHSDLIRGLASILN